MMGKILCVSKIIFSLSAHQKQITNELGYMKTRLYAVCSLCWLRPASSAFLLANNINNVRNATCADAQSSTEWPYCSFPILCIQASRLAAVEKCCMLLFVSSCLIRPSWSQKVLIFISLLVTNVY